MAGLLLESMESDWDPEKYQDTHRQKVEALIEAKRQGDEIVTGVESAPPSTKVVDLMDVLSASIDSVKAGRKPAKKPTGRTPTKVAAKSPSPIKATKSRRPSRRRPRWPNQGPARRKAS